MTETWKHRLCILPRLRTLRFRPVAPPPPRTGGPQSTPLVKAIESGDPASVSRVLAELSPAERKQELAAECAGGGSRQQQQQHDGTAVLSSSSSSSAMLPVFHAASSGNVDVFLTILSALKASLSENAVGLGALVLRRCPSPGVLLVFQG